MVKMGTGMKLIIPLLFFFSIVFSGTADSLKNVISGTAGKVRFEKVLEYADLMKDSNDPEVLVLLNEAIDFATTSDEPVILMKARFLNGNFLFTGEKYREAGEEFKTSLMIAEKIKDTTYLYNNCQKLGVVFYYLSDYKTSSIFYYKALDLSKDMGDEIRQADVQNDLGSVYDELKDYQKALEFYNKALDIYRKNSDELKIAQTINNIAVTQNNQEDYENSLMNFNEALKIYKKAGYDRYEAIILNNMASIEINLKEYDTALRYLNTSSTIFKKHSDNYGLALNDFNYGRVYFIRKNYPTASRHIRNSLKLATEMGVQSLEMDNYYWKAKLDSAVSDYRSAYNSLRKYSELNEKISEESKQREIYEITAKNELAEKEKQNFSLIRDNEIKRLQIEKQKQINNFFIILFVLLSGVSYFAYRSYILKSKNEKMLEEYSEEIRSLNERLNEEIEKTKKELNESNEKLRNTEKETARLDKLVSLGTMVAGITHEIKNPTQVIKLSMESIRLSLNDLAVFIYELIKLNKSGKKGPGEVKELVEKHRVTKLFSDIKSLIISNKKSVELIDQIVSSTSKISRFNRETTENLLNDIISDVLIIMRNSIKYSANITTELDPELPRFRCNYQELAQILINLLTNARDAIDSREIRDEGIIKIRTGSDQNKIFIEVEDNGIGMTHEQVEKSFEAFYTTKPSGAGQGLGLSIVKSIVELYGGMITVNSVPGQGTSFRIYFPSLAVPEIKAEPEIIKENGA
jgi:two-component system, NtrC family, sensor kinase